MLDFFSFDFYQIIDSYKYLAIFVLLTFNGFFNLPSSQIIYLVVGYYISKGELNFWMSVISGTAGNVLGNLILSYIVSKYGISFAKKFIYINDSGLLRFKEKVQTGGTIYLIVGKLIPNLKIFVPIIVAISNLSILKSLLIFILGSGLWAILVIKIGYYFGDSISWQYYSVFIIGIAIITISLFYLRFIKVSIKK